MKTKLRKFSSYEFLWTISKLKSTFMIYWRKDNIPTLHSLTS